MAGFPKVRRDGVNFVNFVSSLGRGRPPMVGAQARQCGTLGPRDIPEEGSGLSLIAVRVRPISRPL